MVFASSSFFELSQWWTVIWKSKPNKPFPSLSCFWSEYLITATEENPHCPLLPGRCVCQPSFTRRNNSRQISASLHNHQRTQGQNNYTLKSQERNANWDVKKKSEYSEESRDLLPSPFIISQACLLYRIFYIMGTDYDEGRRCKGVM